MWSIGIVDTAKCFMTNERFNALLAGPLSHQLPMFHFTRIVIALRTVVEATGEAGEKALEEYCRERQEQDDRVQEEPWE